mgnify:CR=1 FL=1
MDYKDILSILFSFRDDVWTNIGFYITANFAIWGWLIQRHGLYCMQEKIVSTIGYVIFVIIICAGLYKSYSELDLASNELNHAYNLAQSDEKARTISENGILQYYLQKSEEYCKSCISKKNEVKCSKYSNEYWWLMLYFLPGFLFTLALFWWDYFWLNVRIVKNNSSNKNLNSSP